MSGKSARCAPRLPNAVRMPTTGGRFCTRRSRRLSERYRLPLLLCDLEGKTHAQAAIELNCGEATVRRRLASAATPTVAAGPSRRDAVRRRPGDGVRPVGGRGGPSRLDPDDPPSREILRLAGGRNRHRRGRLDDRRDSGSPIATHDADVPDEATAAAVAFLTALVGIAWGIGLPGQEKAGTGRPRCQAGKLRPTRARPLPRRRRPPRAGRSSRIRVESWTRKAVLSREPPSTSSLTDSNIPTTRPCADHWSRWTVPIWC